MHLEGDQVLRGDGQENASPRVETQIGLACEKGGMPVVGKVTFQSTNPKGFFCFQAEVGIRNKLVTGVQTCALPILRRRCREGEACLLAAGREVPSFSKL